MHRGKTSRLIVTVKPKKLTRRPKMRLEKALRTVLSVLDQHDLTSFKLGTDIYLKTYVKK